MLWNLINSVPGVHSAHERLWLGLINEATSLYEQELRRRLYGDLHVHLTARNTLTVTNPACYAYINKFYTILCRIESGSLVYYEHYLHFSYL